MREWADVEGENRVAKPRRKNWGREPEGRDEGLAAAWGALDEDIDEVPLLRRYEQCCILRYN